MRALRTLLSAIAVFSMFGFVSSGNTSAKQTTAPGNLALVERFNAAFEQKDVTTLRELLADHVTLLMPMTFSGNVEPDFVAEGESATIAYFETVFANFSNIQFVDPEMTFSDDGNRVFVETHGHLVLAANGQPYANVYVFRLDFADGQVVSIKGYANPVIAASLFGIPLGTPTPGDE